MSPCEISIESATPVITCPNGADKFLLVNSAGDEFLSLTWDLLKECLAGQEVIHADGDLEYHTTPGFLTEAFVIVPGIEARITIGWQPGETQVGDSIVPTNGDVFTLMRYTIPAAGEVYYINGIPPGSVVTVLKRLVKIT